MSRIRYTLVFMAACALFAGCTRPAGASGPATPAGPAETTAAPETAGPSVAGGQAGVLLAGLTPSQAETLKALGFTVFPSPREVPGFSVRLVAGGTADLAAYRGRVLLLNFWATWCPPCRAEMPSMNRLARSMQGRNFAILAVNQGESDKTVKAFLDANGYRFPAALDESGAVGAAWGVRGIPTTWLIGKDGKALAGTVGGLEWDAPGLLAILNDLAARP